MRLRSIAVFLIPETEYFGEMKLPVNEERRQEWDCLISTEFEPRKIFSKRWFVYNLR